MHDLGLTALLRAGLDELDGLAEDLAWDMGRDVREKRFSDAWLTRYPPT